MKEIEIALQIALDAHKEQEDKGGQPYILHPLRVMHNVTSNNEKIVAILHDVIEDSSYTFSDLAEQGISKECIEALMVLTHNPNVPYMDYITNIAKNNIAIQVKLADLKDNSDLSRLLKITQKDKDRAKKYRIAIAYLDNIIKRDKGD